MITDVICGFYLHLKPLSCSTLSMSNLLSKRYISNYCFYLVSLLLGHCSPQCLFSRVCEPHTDVSFLNCNLHITCLGTAPFGIELLLSLLFISGLFQGCCFVFICFILGNCVSCVFDSWLDYFCFKSLSGYSCCLAHFHPCRIATPLATSS